MGEVRFQRAGQLKDGSFILIDDVPCRVFKVDISKPGKHGSAKCRVEAKGIFDGKARGDLYGSQDDVKVPVIEKIVAQVLSDAGANWQLMNMETYETFEVPKPEPGEVDGVIEPGKEVELMKYDAYLKIAKIRST